MVYLTTYKELDLLHEALFGREEPTMEEVARVAEERGTYLGEGSDKAVYLVTVEGIGTAVLKVPKHSTYQFDNEWIVYGELSEEHETAFAVTNFYVTDKDECYSLMEYVDVAGDNQSLESISGREFEVDYDTTLEYVIEEYYDLDYGTFYTSSIGRFLEEAMNFVADVLQSDAAKVDMRTNIGNFGFNTNGEPVFIDWGWTG